MPESPTATPTADYERGRSNSDVSMQTEQNGTRVSVDPPNSDDTALRAVANIIRRASGSPSQSPTQVPGAFPNTETAAVAINGTAEHRNDRNEIGHLLSEPENNSYLASGLTYFILTGRALACCYRYLMIRAYMDIVFKLPYTNRAPENLKQYLSIAIATFFLWVDVLVSVIKPEKNVKTFLMRLVSKIRHCHMRGEADEAHPWDLRILGAIAIASSGYRGYVGFKSVSYDLSLIPQFDFLSSNPAKIMNTSIAACAALSSSLCFYAYQYKEKSAGSWRTLRQLRESDHQDVWNTVQKQSFYKKEYILGAAVAFAAGVNAAMAPLFHDGKFSPDTWKIALFALLGVPNIIFNLRYAYFRVFMLKRVIKEAEKKGLLAKEEEQKLIPTTWLEKIAESRLFYVITDINSVGNGLTFSAAVIQTLILGFSLIVQQTDSKRAQELLNSPYTYLILSLISVPFIVGAWKQSREMWQGNSYSSWFPCCDKKREVSANNNMHNASSSGSLQVMGNG